MENANLSVIIAKYNLRRERFTRILHTSRLDGKSTIMAFLQTTPLECIPNPHGTSLEISRNFKEAICQTLIYEFWKATRGSSKFPSLPDDTKDQRSSGGDKIRLGIGKPNGIGCHLYNDNNPTIERRKSLTCRICDVYRTLYSLLGLFGIITTITRKLRPISYNDGRIFLYHALKEANQMKRWALLYSDGQECFCCSMLLLFPVYIHIKTGGHTCSQSEKSELSSGNRLFPHWFSLRCRGFNTSFELRIGRVLVSHSLPLVIQLEWERRKF